MTGVQSRHPKSCAEGSWRRGGAAAIACLALGVVFCARPAAAETLVEALSNAYLINPVLNAERANLRATDEQSPSPSLACAPASAPLATRPSETRSPTLSEGAGATFRRAM